MAKFVTFKVCKDESVPYPPLLGDDFERAQVSAVFGASSANTAAAAATKGGKAGKGAAVTASASTAQVKASSAAAAAAAAEDAADAAEAGAQAKSAASADGDTTAFHALDPNALPLMDANAAKQAVLFADMVVLVAREVPFEPIAFVIRSGGGVALGESFLTVEQAKSTKFTHQVVDRHALLSYLPSRTYVQPQWVVDSFNERHLLPTEPYAAGAKLPPHLSPFVNDERVGYVPEQRNVLRKWVGLAPIREGAQVSLKREPTAEEAAEAQDQEDEAEYRKGIQAEVRAARNESRLIDAAEKKQQAAKDRKNAKKELAKPADAATATKAKAQQAKQQAQDDDDDDDEEEEEDGEEFEFQASDMESGDEGAGSDDDVEIDGDVDGVDNDDDDDSEDELDDEEAETTAAGANDDEDDDDEDDEDGTEHAKAPRPNTFNQRNSERELAKMMLKRRHSYIINEKDRKKKLSAQKAQVLQVKRDAHAAGVENPDLPKVHRKRFRK